MPRAASLSAAPVEDLRAVGDRGVIDLGEEDADGDDTASFNDARVLASFNGGTSCLGDLRGEPGSALLLFVVVVVIVVVVALLLLLLW